MQTSTSQFIRTCFVTPPATSLRMMVTIHVPFSRMLAIRTSSTRFATPNWPRTVSRTSGGIRWLARTGKAPMAPDDSFPVWGLEAEKIRSSRESNDAVAWQFRLPSLRAVHLCRNVQPIGFRAEDLKRSIERGWIPWEGRCGSKEGS